MSQLLRRSATAAVALVCATTATAEATPPGIPSKSTAQAELSALSVATEGSLTGYDREEFPHWITITGTCNTRETVLKRDGSSVSTDSACAATSGSWFSEYDGATTSSAGSFDIDHVVPLAEAWRSGASSWTTSRRQAFANDLEGPQLIAVSASSNRSKGDEDPSTWQPTRTTYRCTYAKMWVHTKARWDLKLQSAEKTALNSMLATC